MPSTPTSPGRSPSVRYARWASFVLAAVALILVLQLHLLAALLAGLTVHVLIQGLGHRLIASFTGYRRLAVIVLLGIGVVAALTPLVLALVSWVSRLGSQWSELAPFLQSLLDQARRQLPPALLHYLPDDAAQAQANLLSWLHEHVSEVRLVGATAVTTTVHLLVGLVLGAMVAFEAARPEVVRAPLANALTERVALFANAFHQVVVAQVRISLINTLLTAIFLWIVLPLLGYHLPLATTLLIVTLVAGLLPVIGNLISNAAIVVVALSVSLETAIAALVFLVVVHKLEYFLNARLVGSRVHATAWELLIAMVLFEAAFGLAGLIAAPIYYAYLKAELVRAGWV